MFGLDTDTLRNIKEVFSKYSQIEKATLYGSRAKGNYLKGSDIDITLTGKELNLNNTVYPLMDAIEELYLPYTFDISIFDHIDNKNLIDHINRVGKIFYQKEKVLPDGWKLKRLGDVCEKLFAGGDVPKNNFSKIKTDKFDIPIFSNGIKNKGLYGYTDIKTI